MLDLYSMSANNSDLGDIIRIGEVLSITGLGRTMLYKLIREETFPRQVALGDRAVGWYKNLVLDWTRNRPVKQAKKKGVRDDTRKQQDSTLGTVGPASSTASKGTKCKTADSSANALHAGVNKRENVILLQGDSDVNQGAKRTFVGGKAKSLSAAATETEKINHLRDENAQLREMLADLALQNHTLQAEVRKMLS